MNKTIIAIRVNGRHIASYSYAIGKAADIMARLTAFYTGCFPAAEIACVLEDKRPAL